VPTSRSYGDACGIARALDIIGERWALLVVRELLLGPQRFSELRKGMPNASSNLLSDRLRELQEHDVVIRRKLAPPAGSWVYELTETGRELEPIVLALGNWGLRCPVPPAATLSGTSVLLYLKDHVRIRRGSPVVTLRIQLGDQVWGARVGPRGAVIRPGEAAGADVAVSADPGSFDQILHDPAALDAAVESGAVEVMGDIAALRALLGAVEPVPMASPA
jgi:DNA-binding HxlR family transcriptional regulator